MRRILFCFILLLAGSGCEPFNLERKNFADCKTPAGSIDATISRLQVTARLSAINGPLRTIEWDFGDGRSLPQNGERATYLYDRPGTYTIRAKLTSTCSLTATPTRTVTVSE